VATHARGSRKEGSKDREEKRERGRGRFISRGRACGGYVVREGGRVGREGGRRGGAYHRRKKY